MSEKLNIGISLYAGDRSESCRAVGGCTELGGQLTWLLPTLILVCLCCRCVPSALCRLSLEVFLTLLRQAGSRGLCLEGLAPVCPFPTGMALLSWSGHSPHPLSSPGPCCSWQSLARHSTSTLRGGAWCPSSPGLETEARGERHLAL